MWSVISSKEGIKCVQLRFCWAEEAAQHMFHPRYITLGANNTTYCNEVIFGTTLDIDHAVYIV